MDVYLASLHTLTHFKNGEKMMDIYLAGTYPRPYVIEGALKSDIYLAGAATGGNITKEMKRKIFEGDNMDLYLAGTMYGNQSKTIDALKIPIKQRLFILESFYYADDFTEKYIPYFDKFMLDSGAFTFMQAKKNHTVNWDDYIERYADFINRNKVDLFFELDIDIIVGIKEVERLRNRLERLTCKQSIPVWHKSRGKDYYLRMCDEYPYVALGGLLPKMRNEMKKYFPWFIDRAHERGAKIHGLGFTDLKGLPKYHFDSVDSTAWTGGNRFGYAFIFTGKTMIQRKRLPGERMVNTQQLALHNFNEWVKFQRYAEKHL